MLEGTWCGGGWDGIVCYVRRNMVWWGMGWDGIVCHVRRNMVLWMIGDALFGDIDCIGK